jgi:hypothetical protein
MAFNKRHLRLVSVSKPRPEGPLPCSAGRAANCEDYK